MSHSKKGFAANGKVKAKSSIGLNLFNRKERKAPTNIITNPNYSKRYSPSSSSNVSLSSNDTDDSFFRSRPRSLVVLGTSSSGRRARHSEGDLTSGRELITPDIDLDLSPKLPHDSYDLDTSFGISTPEMEQKYGRGLMSPDMSIFENRRKFRPRGKKATSLDMLQSSHECFKLGGKCSCDCTLKLYKTESAGNLPKRNNKIGRSSHGALPYSKGQSRPRSGMPSAAKMNGDIKHSQYKPEAPTKAWSSNPSSRQDLLKKANDIVLPYYVEREANRPHSNALAPVSSSKRNQMDSANSPASSPTSSQNNFSHYPARYDNATPVSVQKSQPSSLKSKDAPDGKENQHYPRISPGRQEIPNSERQVSSFFKPSSTIWGSPTLNERRREYFNTDENDGKLDTNSRNVYNSAIAKPQEGQKLTPPPKYSDLSGKPKDETKPKPISKYNSSIERPKEGTILTPSSKYSNTASPLKSSSLDVLSRPRTAPQSTVLDSSKNLNKEEQSDKNKTLSNFKPKLVETSSTKDLKNGTPYTPSTSIKVDPYANLDIWSAPRPLKDVEKPQRKAHYSESDVCKPVSSKDADSSRWRKRDYSEGDAKVAGYKYENEEDKVIVKNLLARYAENSLSHMGLSRADMSSYLDSAKRQLGLISNNKPKVSQPAEKVVPESKDMSIPRIIIEERVDESDSQKKFIEKEDVDILPQTTFQVDGAITNTPAFRRRVRVAGVLKEKQGQDDEDDVNNNDGVIVLGDETGFYESAMWQGIRSGDVIYTRHIPAYNLWTQSGEFSKSDPIPEELLELDMNEGRFEAVLPLLNECIRYKHLTSTLNSWLNGAYVAAAFLMIWLLGFVLCCVTDLAPGFGPGMMFIVAIMVVLGVVGAFKATRRKVVRRYENTLLEINRVLSCSDLFVVISNTGVCPMGLEVKFVFFDCLPCQKILLVSVRDKASENILLTQIARRHPNLMDVITSDLEGVSSKPASLGRRIILRDILLYFAPSFLDTFLKRKGQYSGKVHPPQGLRGTALTFCEYIRAQELGNALRDLSEKFVPPENLSHIKTKGARKPTSI